MREARPPTAAGCSFRSPRSSGVRSGFIARTFKAPNMVPSSQPRTPAALPSDSCLTPPLTPSPTSGPQTDSPTSQGGAQRRDGQVTDAVRCEEESAHQGAGVELRWLGSFPRPRLRHLPSPTSAFRASTTLMGLVNGRPRGNRTFLPTFPVPTRWRRSQRAHNLRFFWARPRSSDREGPDRAKGDAREGPDQAKGDGFPFRCFLHGCGVGKLDYKYEYCQTVYPYQVFSVRVCLIIISIRVLWLSAACMYKVFFIYRRASGALGTHAWGYVVVVRRRA